MVVDVPLPEDCLQHLVKHLDLRALVRSSEVCRAWRQAASSAEPWELLYAKSWGDTELVAGCDTLRASYRSRYAMLVALPPLLCEWGECAERVERTTAAERLDHLATAQRCAESLLGCVRHLSKALEALSRDNGGGQAPDAADSALADIPIPLSVLKGRCIGRRPGEIRRAAAHAAWLARDVTLRDKWSQLLGEAGAAGAGSAAAAALVEEGACLVEELERPVDRSWVAARLDRLAAQVRALVDPDAADATVERVLGAMNKVLFEREGLRGNTDNYYEPANSFVTEVLERRLGIPISLSVVYMCVGRRLGVRLEGVNAPGHFLLRTRSEKNVEVYIDVFAGGVLLDVDGVAALLQRFGWPPERLALPPCPPPMIFARMMRNVAHTLRPPEGGEPARSDGIPSRRTHSFVLCLSQLVQVMKRCGEDGVQFYEPEIALFRATGLARILNP